MEFVGLQKKVERVDWITTTLVWVDCTTPRKEWQRKSDRQGSGSRMTDGGGLLHSIVVDPQLWIMDTLGEMKSEARSENLRAPWRWMLGRPAYAITPRENASGIVCTHTRPCGEILRKT